MIPHDLLYCSIDENFFPMLWKEQEMLLDLFSVPYFCLLSRIVTMYFFI